MCPFEQLMESAPNKLGEWLPIVNMAKLYYGECLIKLERYLEAEPVLLEAHTALTQILGESSVPTRPALQAIVSLYELWGRPDQAEEYRSRTESHRDTPQSIR